MLTTYIQNAMRLAKYEILGDGQYYGKIPGFQGVWAQADNLETCREELQSALEDWLLLGLRMGHKLPVVAGIHHPHQGEISMELLARVLNQANINRAEWEKL